MQDQPGRVMGSASARIRMFSGRPNDERGMMNQNDDCLFHRASFLVHRS
jgi:hypothetical protein